MFFFFRLYCPRNCLYNSYARVIGTRYYSDVSLHAHLRFLHSTALLFHCFSRLDGHLWSMRSHFASFEVSRTWHRIKKMWYFKVEVVLKNASEDIFHSTSLHCPTCVFKHENSVLWKILILCKRVFIFILQLSALLLILWNHCNLLIMLEHHYIIKKHMIRDP